ncbi:hypothetical protein [Mycobacterium talmoniae]|uniref:Uncharacterized protein n=1 Tax=Mycobacterium talmoniae TaxID=1858794 RepID=A0A1S1NMZ2_9MYCO|nr:MULTISPECIES: hypothetical protein [Mycobacterium]OHV04628.1 hypothetical protein BKN37_08945 [Mycobacterium talmoniae]TDH53630.1 hypothetical protein E2F47_12490 [Mycobacterium eburneum]
MTWTKLARQPCAALRAMPVCAAPLGVGYPRGRWLIGARDPRRAVRCRTRVRPSAGIHVVTGHYPA